MSTTARYRIEPVILLAFANEWAVGGRYLRDIVAERKALTAALAADGASRRYRVIAEANATLADLDRLIEEHREAIIRVDIALTLVFAVTATYAAIVFDSTAQWVGGITAMILPGISGSFILLILGQYAFVLNAIKTLDILTLLPFGVGVVIGITGFARILSWLLRHYHQMTITLLVGFMIGSLRKIWPFKETLETRVDRHGDVVPILERNILPDIGTAFWMSLTLCVVGFVLIRVLDRMSGEHNPFVRMTEEG